MAMKMNTIEKLLAELCPEGVVFKELGNVCEIADNKRRPVKSGLRVPGKIPYYGANNIQDYVEGFTHDGEYVLLAEDGSADLRNYSVQYATGKFWANNHVHVIRGTDEVLNRFLFHWFRHMDFVPFLSGGTRTKLTKAKMLEIQIPIPPIAIQQEIVRILDTFTTLEAELEAELEARKKQYEYYRDELLTFGEDVVWKTLGEVARILRGASPRPIAKYITNDEDGIPWIKIGDTSPSSKYVNRTAQKITPEGAKKSRVLKKGDFIMSNSMSFGRPHILNIDGAIHDGWVSIGDFGDKLNSDYLFHYLSSDSVQSYWFSKINSGSVSNLNADIIKTLQIPIPPLAEQERIVAILDKFDTLVNDISVGLPAELNARRTQYEYYRNKLLSFEEASV